MVRNLIAVSSACLPCFAVSLPVASGQTADALPGAGPTASPYVLWYDQPARTAMTQALPVGNGRLGGLVFGATDRERIAFTVDSLWTGDTNPSGEYSSMGSYQAFGDLFLAIENPLVTTAQVSSPSGQQPSVPGEGVAASFDDDPTTKWCVSMGTPPVAQPARRGQGQAASQPAAPAPVGIPVVWSVVLPEGAKPVTSYTFTSARDTPRRDPRTWEFAGSNDGQTWTTLDRRQDRRAIGARGGTDTYEIKTPGAYRHYRLTIEANNGEPLVQLAEIGLLTADGGAVTGYRRDLDLTTASAGTRFSRDGVEFERDVFASAADNVMVVRWRASKPGAISGSIQLRGTHDEKTAVSASTATFSGALANGMKYAAAARVSHKGGTVSVRGSDVAVDGCDEVTVVLAAETNYAMNPDTNYRSDVDPAQRVAAQVAAAALKGYDVLKAAHLRDFQPIFNRVALDVGESTAAQKAMPTNLRKVEAFKTVDPDFEELLFQYGRYLLISCSRPGALPANLQGLWNDSNRPPWFSDYHSNINVQMNYWPAEVTNLAEMHTPFFDLIRSQLPAWRTATNSAPEYKTNTGAPNTRGFAIRTSHNISGGMGWKWDKTANAWYCQHLWEHYAFGQDQQYLRDVAYPVIKETTEFWEDHLKTLPDGRLVVPRGWSPEHGPTEDGVSYNQQIVYDLFTNYVQAATVLGVDDEYRAKVAAMRDKLVGPAIGRWGQLQEWMTDRDEENNHHRHTSHLFAVFPGRQIGVTKTPELAKAAKVSLDARGIDAGSDVREWSFAWRTSLYARLHDGESAHRMVQQLFSDRNTCPNMFGLHPPMQIDGNLGVTAGIAEMLVQSHEGEIYLLPALPTVWPSGSVKGLRARGGYEVDIAWADNKLTSATVRAKNPGKATIRYGSKTAEVAVEPAKPVSVEKSLMD
ncbi:MAG TPA: glycoside hydrolase N-terminal domain-containing protein [Tepidisphaeraceae bacterium]|jgi:alpha-L-fucosidase 2